MNEILNRRIHVVGMDFMTRDLAALACLLTWIALMLLRSGGHGISSLVDTAMVVALILLVTAATRTVSWRTLLSMFMAGGFTMVIVAVLSNMMFGNTSGGLRPIVVPILEELGFLAPPLVMLWRNRRVSYALTTSDIFVVAAICGAGFAMVEEAAMRAAGTWGTAPIPFLPGCIIVGDRIHGEHLSNAQYVWGGLAGAAIGLALYLRHQKIIGLQIAGAGVVVGLVDHVINNAKAAIRSIGIGGDWLLATFSLVFLNGYLVPVLFVVAMIAVVVFDLSVMKRLPERFRFETKGGVLKRWQSMLDARRLAFAHHYSQTLSGTAKEDAEVVAGFCAFRAWRGDSAKPKDPAPKQPTAESPTQPPPTDE